MSQPDPETWNGCPVRYAAGMLGDKWCFMIIRDILIHGKRTYGELAASPEGISTNILANRLARMQKAGLLRGQTDPRKGSRVCYFPTQKMRDLLPALLNLMVWAARYDPNTEAPDSFTDFFEEDPIKAVSWYEAQINEVDRAILGEGSR